MRWGDIVPAVPRLMILVAGAALVLVLAPLRPVPTALIIAGTVLAVAVPARVGASGAATLFVLCWLSRTGWHGDPSLGRTTAAAAALYVVHSATGLAAMISRTAAVDSRVLWRHALWSIGVLAAAGLFVALDYTVGVEQGPPVAELAGLVGVVILVAVPIYVLLRRNRN